MLPLSVETVRDYSLIAFCIAGVIAFVLIIFATLISTFLSWNILSRIRKILKENVQPATANVRETTQNIKGTVSYISDNAVKPVVKVYGVAAGARQFVKVVSRFTKKKDEAKA
jgi:uncharacterized protein (DUF697 family)